MRRDDCVCGGGDYGSLRFLALQVIKIMQIGVGWGRSGEHGFLTGECACKGRWALGRGH